MSKNKIHSILLTVAFLSTSLAYAVDGDIEERLSKSTYECTAVSAGKTPWNFTIGFRQSPYPLLRFIATFSGDFTNSSDESILGEDSVTAAIDFIDPVEKKISMNAENTLKLDLDHHGHPRNFRSRMTIINNLNSGSGELSYIVGQGSARKRMKRTFTCSI